MGIRVISPFYVVGTLIQLGIYSFLKLYLLLCIFLHFYCEVRVDESNSYLNNIFADINLSKYVLSSLHTNHVH